MKKSGDLTWSLSGGTLTVSGNGAMPNYSKGETPRDGYRESITAVIINNGMTTIGRSALSSPPPSPRR